MLKAIINHAADLTYIIAQNRLFWLITLKNLNFCYHKIFWTLYKMLLAEISSNILF